MRLSPRQSVSGRKAPPERVLHLTPALFASDGGFVGGAERYVFELARYMSEVVDTTLVAFGDRSREEVVGRLRVRVIEGNPWMRERRSWPLPVSLLREIRRADVVHCHQQHVLAHSLTALVGRVLGRPVFVTDLGGGGWDISAYVSTDRWFSGHLHISEYSRRIYGHEGKPWARVIWGGVDTDKFAPDPAGPVGGPAVFVGRLMPHKGVNDLIAGAPADLPVEIIGEAREPDFVRELYSLAEGKQVRFRHACGDSDLVRAYQRALCVVLPSVYRNMYGFETVVPELLGLTLLEGMACGLPAVCTDVASLPEIVEDGVTGFVVPHNDPQTLGARLQWLRAHPEQARRMGAAARERVLENFTWAKVVQRCLEIYDA